MWTILHSLLYYLITTDTLANYIKFIKVLLLLTLWSRIQHDIFIWTYLGIGYHPILSWTRVTFFRLLEELPLIKGIKNFLCYINYGQSLLCDPFLHKHNVLEITIKSKRQLDLTTISMQPFACRLRAALWVDCKHAIFSFLRRPHMTFLSFFVYNASIIKLSHSEFQKIIFFRVIGVNLYNPFSGIIRLSCGFSTTSAHAPQVLMHLVWLLSAWQSESHFWLQGREDLLPFCS